MSDQINEIGLEASPENINEILGELRKDTAALSAVLTLNLDRYELDAVRLIGARVSAGLGELDRMA